MQYETYLPLKLTAPDEGHFVTKQENIKGNESMQLFEFKKMDCIHLEAMKWLCCVFNSPAVENSLFAASLVSGRGIII